MHGIGSGLVFSSSAGGRHWLRRSSVSCRVDNFFSKRSSSERFVLVGVARSRMCVADMESRRWPI